MPFILGTNSIKDTGFDVANSLRFNRGSSDTLTRTPSSASNRKTFTFSTWVKRSNVADKQQIFGVEGGNSNTTWFRLNFSGSETLNFEMYFDEIITNRVFRDVSAWYHIVLAIDTTQGTASNRVKIYINGVQETSFSSSTYPSQNQDLGLNNNVAHNFGGVDSSNYPSHYLCETVLIDGQQLDPTSFGEFDEDSGIWKPKDVSGLTFGTNGFYLDFEDSSALGNDAAGSNNFTVNNLTAVDQSIDSCTNNFCTMNPLDNFYQGATFSEGNIKLVTYSGSGKYTWNTSTIGVSSGKWYWEVKVSSTGNDFDTIGFAPSVSTSATAILGDTTNSVGWHGYNGQFRKAASVLATLSTYTTNDILSFALDLDNNLIYVYKNGSIQNSGTGISITAAASVSSGFYFPAAGTNDNAAGTYEFNFGSPSFSISSGNTDGNGYGNFEYAVPSGYFSLNTKNLAEYG